MFVPRCGIEGVNQDIRINKPAALSVTAHAMNPGAR